MNMNEELGDELDKNGQSEATVDKSEEKPKSKRRRGKKNAEKEKIEELTSEVGELKDKYLRLLAEFENYKKRTVREKLDLMGTAAQDTLSSLLPVLDDFDRAKSIADDDSKDEVFSDGVQIVYNKLFGQLGTHGLTKMESTGETFDPELHEAITEIPAPTEDLKGKVIDTIETGYYLKDKIIRHAKVVVGK